MASAKLLPQSSLVARLANEGIFSSTIAVSVLCPWRRKQSEMTAVGTDIMHVRERMGCRHHDRLQQAMRPQSAQCSHDDGGICTNRPKARLVSCEPRLHDSKECGSACE